ncbi:MAG: murein L,D-transpeptidase [Alphaproteobacteria bacterium]|nr:MAG: murein L,D-transpeptidase [Alphaproteobacteria bacterium]
MERHVKKLVLAGAALLAVAGAGVAQNAAAPAKGAALDQSVLEAQVLLDRADFSPGVIDGQGGPVFEAAVRGFQQAHDIEESGKIDDATRQALAEGAVPATIRLRVDEGDAQGPFVGPIPHDPAVQAGMQRLGYRNLLEKLAEKFHTTPETIVALNNPKTVLRAGTVLVLPNVLPSARAYGNAKPEVAQLLSDLNVDPNQKQADKVVVDKSDKLVRVYAEDGTMIAQFPATLGSSKDPLPLGNWKVNTIAFNPPFKYQPQLFWDVPDDQPERMLPPGPNGPVGVVWVDLNRENIGIHGTNSPETIKRAESHGCVRLTNWDVARLTQMISDGMEVVFQA